MDGLFSLKEGNVITVPVGVVRQNSKSRQASQETPKVLRLRQVRCRQGSLFEIKTYNDEARARDASEYRGKVLFAPANISPGDKLRIFWVDPNCACAVLAN